MGTSRLKGGAYAARAHSSRPTMEIDLMRVINRLAFVSTLALGVSAATAQAPIIYPAKNQSPEQQQKDQGECAQWAKQTTGIDPVVLASTPTAAPPAAAAAPAAEPAKSGPGGERLRGAARGAAAGAIVGEITDSDTGDAAGVGAVTGAVAAGGRDRRGQRQQQQQAAQQQQQAAQQQQATQQQAEAKKQEQLATYNRANSACLEGRGYTIK